MPRKRKVSEPTIKTRPITNDELKTVSEQSAQSAQSAQLQIRCIYDSRLIISADKTPSRTRYEFDPGQIKPVNAEDYLFLLAMETRPLGCCGGSMEPQRFFEEV